MQYKLYTVAQALSKFAKLKCVKTKKLILLTE